MKIKTIIEHHYTKCDVNGNVYHAVTIINANTGRSFTTSTPSTSNIRCILSQAIDKPGIYETEACTNSARLSSLPEHIHLPACHFDREWRKALRAIGFTRLNAIK